MSDDSQGVVSRSTWYWITLGLVLLTHVLGLFTEVMQGDSALYASIAKQMAQSNNYVELFVDGSDWLDKPHFQFWISALSFELFGISAFAFKLPAVLFIMMAAAYTYLLARRLYDQNVAALAVLVLLTAEHLVLSSNDVRAEPYLTGFIVGAVYHFYLVVQDNNARRNLIAGSLLCAGALMTKGPFTVIPIFAGIVGGCFFEGRARELLRVRWLAALGLTGLLTAPELYAVYVQFDLHPEKIVFGTTGVSGIRWFLWDSQFGRFTNTAPMRGRGDPLFFLHTLLWAFLPWGVLLYFALWRRISGAIRRGVDLVDGYTLSAALSMLIVFSASKFQLPHYANIVFPFLAIITAHWIASVRSSRETTLYRRTQYFTIALASGLLVAVHLTFRPARVPGAFLILVVAVALAFVFVGRQPQRVRMTVFYRSCFSSVLVNAYFLIVVYPALLAYQSGSRAAEYVNEQLPGQEIVTVGRGAPTLFLQANALVRRSDVSAFDVGPSSEGTLIFTGLPELEQLEARGFEVVVLRSFDHFRITVLTPAFLDHRQRPSQVSTRLLARVNAP